MAASPEMFYRKEGVSIIQKLRPEDLAGRKSKMALVLAGGAVSGGAYKIGGIRALDDYLISRKVGRKDVPYAINDFDTFVGLSAGSILASSLAAGIVPDEILRIMTGTSHSFERFRPHHFFWPNIYEPLEKLLMFVDKEWEVLSNWILRETCTFTGRPYSLRDTLIKMLTVLPRLLPSGLLDNRNLAKFIAKNIERADLPDHFVKAYETMGKELYITAVDLNTGESIIFGHDEKYRDVPVSRAIAASCGLPLFYKTVRVRNPRFGEPGERRFLDLADGGIVRTANVKVAIDKGADLIVCYNPFTSINYPVLDRSLYEHGPYALVSQVMRILLGSRLDLSKQWFAHDESIKADIIYIEPAEDDFIFFLMNPLNFWSKDRAAEHGFTSVKKSIDGSYDRIREIFENHGIRISRKYVDREAGELKRARHEDEKIEEILTRPSPPKKVAAALRLAGK